MSLMPSLQSSLSVSLFPNVQKCILPQRWLRPMAYRSRTVSEQKHGSVVRKARSLVIGKSRISVVPAAKKRDFDDAEVHEDYPMVRTFENDLCRLVVIGDKDAEEAIVAAAADGGVTAEEHIASKRPFMVIETVYPGHSSNHSTVATRLHVPAKKVLEKAKKLRLTLGLNAPKESLSSEGLAIAFHNVVLQHMWTFELSIFNPGTCRDMEKLSDSRNEHIFGCVSSSDERLISSLAEALCTYMISSVENDFSKQMFGRAANNKRKWITSSDSHIRIGFLTRSEIAGILKDRMGKNNLPQAAKNGMEPAMSIHKVQIDAKHFHNVKFQGWQECENNVWEIYLTRRQLVEVADVVDMYFEDPNTCPGKKLHSHVIIDDSVLVMNKTTMSFWRIVTKLIIGGMALVVVTVLARIWKPSLLKKHGPLASNIRSIQSSAGSVGEVKQPVLPCNKLLSSKEKEVLCALVLQTVKDALVLHHDIQTKDEKGAWIGEDLTSWALEDQNKETETGSESRPLSRKNVDIHGESPNGVDISKPDSTLKVPVYEDQQKEDQKASSIAVYELTLSRNGTVLGFQPLNRAAVNRWAGNPLAKSLYNKKKLSPGLIELGLKFKGAPKEPIVIELLMSDDPTNFSVTARPSYT